MPAHVRDAGGEVVIVSSDKDLMQLVGDRVSMLDTMKNLRIGRAEVFEKFGVPPEKVVDVQALCGDSVDNVPGAPGIGVKTASALITEYGDLDTLLARAGEIKQDKRRQTLIDFADQIRLSRELVRLDCDTPLPAPIDTLAVAAPEPATLAAFLEAMEFRTLARRVADGRGGRRSRRAAPPAGDRRAAPARRRSTPRRLCLRARPRDPGRAGSPGRARPGSSPSTPRPTPCPRPTPASAASPWPWPRARPATSRSATARPTAWPGGRRRPRPDPLRGGRSPA